MTREKMCIHDAVPNSQVIRVILFAALQFAACTAVCNSQDWLLWPGAYGETEKLDQCQPLATTGFNCYQNGNPSGQTFTPSMSPLTRLDLMFYGHNDMRPFTLAIRKWQTDYATTIAGPILFSDTLVVPGPELRTILTTYPQLNVQTGQLYFVEFTNATSDSECLPIGVGDGTNHYVNGQFRVNGYLRDTMDLYLKTYSSSEGASVPPVFASSDTNLAWTPPPAPGALTGPADYFNVVKAYVDEVRWYYIAVTSQYNVGESFYEAFLYRATSNETYASNCVRLLEAGYAWRMAHTNEGVGFTWMERPAFAYMWVKDSPSITSEQHTKIKWLILDSARKFWTGREYGTHNRVLGGCLSYKLVTTLWNDMPEYAEWKAYADLCWAEFKSAMDTGEDSSHYSWLAWTYILELVMLYGEDDTIWSDPRFRELAGNMLAESTPLGPGPGCGDSNGWGLHWCIPVWLAEKAAVKLGRPEYRWSAYRSFDYPRQHLKNIGMHRAWYQELQGLAFAYFDANPAIPILPPRPISETMLTAQTADGSSICNIQAGSRIGQTFTVGANLLAGFNVRARSAPAGAKLEMRLWRWTNDYQQTVASVPIFRDLAERDLKDEFRVRKFQPFLDLQTGVTYYAELSSTNSAFDVAVSDAVTDRYGVGQVLVNGVAQTNRDLWFEALTLTNQASSVLWRRLYTPRRLSQITAEDPRWCDPRDEMIPDKLVLRSGYDPNDFFVLVNLVAGRYGHGHGELGAVQAVTDRGALLLADATYDQKMNQDHSMAIVRRHWGGTYTGTPDRVSVDLMREYRNAVVARFSWTDYYGWDILQERRFIFVKNAFLLVRDRATARTAVRASFGSLWHTADMHPEHSSNWYDVYVREPLGLNGWLFKNPERHALLYMVSRAGREMASWKASYSGNPPAPPYISYQRFSGDIPANSDVWCDTLILPHGPEQTPAEAAGAVSVLYDDGTNVAIRVVYGGNTWTVADNPGGIRIEAGDFSTDAEYAVTRVDHASFYMLVRNANCVESGALRREFGVRTSVEAVLPRSFNGTVISVR